MRILIDICKEEDFTIRQSHKNILGYLKQRKLITLEDGRWIITEAGVQLIKTTFFCKSKYWRPLELLPEDDMAY